MAMRHILGNIKQADLDFNLIEDNDRIAVGVSGGKDSIVLLYALTLYKLFSKKIFHVIGIHINLGFPNMDFSETLKFCQDKNIEFYSYDSDVYEILKLNLRKNGMLECSICSKMKKATVIKAAIKHNCNKVAFAHHCDDAIETLFLNMIYGGRIATFEPKMYMSKNGITFIRPLIYAREKEINSTCKKEQLPLVVSTCPNDKYTKREDIKNLIKNINKQFPESYKNFKLMLTNTDKLSILDKNKPFKMD